MKNVFAAVAAALTLTLPLIAQAYVGPGAGLSLLGALWALLIALGTALLFVVAWPLRKMIRRRRAERAALAEEAPAAARAEASSAPAQHR